VSVTQGMAASVLVGRVDDLATLDAALAQVRQGEPSTVLIGGEAGVGKSRLVNEFSRRAAGAVRVVCGHCLELSADGLPFAPFTGVLRELARELGADGVAGLVPGGGAADLARLLPELGEPAVRADPGEARARMFEQVLVLFEHLAEAGPVVLVIEDAHWSDRSTRDLLTFLVGNQHVLGGVLIVVTFRSDELDRGHPLRPVLAELGRLGWVVRLELPRLTRREARELTACLLGRELGPDLAARLYGRSEGNPLFLEALLRRGDMLDPGLPESLRDLVLADVRQLPAETQKVLQALGIAGQWCGHALLAAVTGMGETALLAAVSRAVSANVLVPGADGYAFRHALIREAILGEVLPGEGTRLHVCLAEALAADPSLVPPGRAAIEQAHHWYAAHRNALALESAWQAAAEAGRFLAHAEKLAMLARILELWPTLPDAAQRIGASYLSVLESAVEAALAAGEDEPGIGFATAALQEVDAAGEPARAALMLKARARMKWHLGLGQEIEDVREALRLVPPAFPGPVRGQVLSWLAARLNTSGEPGARTAAEEALRASRQAGDAETEAHALITLAELSSCERVALSLNLLQQARELGEQVQSHDVLLRAAIIESHVLEGAGEHERAAQVARQGVAYAREYGLARTTGALLTANLAEPLASLGQWEEAAEVIEHALELSPPVGTRAALLVLAGEVTLAQGDLARAAQSAAASRGALAGAGYRDQNHLPLARLEAGLCLAQDRAGDALTVTEEALGRFGPALSPRYVWPLVATGARACGTALPAAHDLELAGRARRLLDRLRAQAEKLSAAGALQQAHRLTFAAEAAEAARAGGSAGSAGADAVSAWDAAARAWESLGQPYSRAQALARAAQAAMERGDRKGAAERLGRAAPLADRLGVAPLREQIGSLARRARLGLPTVPSGGQPPGTLGLTAREVEVLRLVAAGRSNRDIAAELFISAKTASVHVSNILAKLNAASRTEAAAIAHRAGLASDGS
jgi:ATP/maltotriose-dependent transcriptional regulator MalT